MQKRSALFWDSAQRRVLIPYRRFGTTHRSHLKGTGFIVPWKPGPICWPGTSVRNYHCTLPGVPEERRCKLSHR